MYHDITKGQGNILRTGLNMRISWVWKYFKNELMKRTIKGFGFNAFG